MTTYTVREHYAMGKSIGDWQVRDEDRMETIATCPSEAKARWLAYVLNTHEKHRSAAA
jgi:hypothetical protein